MRLLDYKKDIFSQTGEDGVLAKVLSILPDCDKWCVEFGAWDGQLFSNTCHLVDEAGYSAVMIEGDKDRFKDLMKRHGNKPGFIGLNAMVGFTEADSLDHLLAQTPIPKNFDLLSIDIDGNDYYTWKATVQYRPKVVVIEFNPTIPAEYEFVQEPDPTLNQGCSLLSLNLLGKSKGYELVAVTKLNAIFVLAEYYPLFGITDNSLQTLREDTSHITYLAATYDGRIMVLGNDRMPWHGIKYAWIIRRVPKIFRSYPGNFGPIRLWFFKHYKSIIKRIRFNRPPAGLKTK